RRAATLHVVHERARTHSRAQWLGDRDRIVQRDERDRAGWGAGIHHRVHAAVGRPAGCGGARGAFPSVPEPSVRSRTHALAPATRLSTSAASGGRVTTVEYGQPCAGTCSTTTRD